MSESDDDSGIDKQEDVSIALCILPWWIEPSIIWCIILWILFHSVCSETGIYDVNT